MTVWSPNRSKRALSHHACVRLASLLENNPPAIYSAIVSLLIYEAIGMSRADLRAEMIDARVKERGLTLARARTLLALIEQEGLYQKELAEALEIENATMVRLLDGLERQSFIERQAVQGDRRAKRVVMTAEGKQLAAQVEKLAGDVREDLLDGVSDEELSIALNVMRKMSSSMSKTH
ncbi:transcriptional regulator, MarR family [Brucella ovis ATCC 25840]|uniref:Transcriptional regulator, MarR family n=2 Tax=Brucella ovis TaxID=236 RepID=A0A0H3APA3_BRUO2|nr:transcriptional regulator, MarR family [Brucella ovis ATCC 25840]